MKRVFRLEDLDCAGCAAKMERLISEIEGVTAVRINFLTQKMTLEAEDAVFDEALKKATKLIRRVEPDCRVIL